ncbi:MAG: DNA polymerase III subunit alpha [Candidatus Gottesmanbacteria bacterium]
MAADFIHLHTHSEFSLLDGLGKLDHLIEKAKTFGMDALAITDHGAMYGSFKFYMKAVTAGIKPIIGVETYVARRSRFDKESKIDTDSYHLILLAENNKGYQNLMKLVSVSHLEGFYYKPRVDVETLQKYHEGIICLSACLQGQIGQLLLRGEEKEAEKIAKQYAEVYGDNHYYLEIQRHVNIPQTDEVTEKIVKLARRLGLPIVATNDIHYVNPDDAEAQEILLCVQTQRTILEKNRPLSMINSPDFYMRSPDEMKELFAEYPEAIENTVRIANMCHLELTIGEWHLPKYPVPDSMTPEIYLRKLIEERLPLRYKEVTKEIRDRIEYEFDVINKKNYTSYFLITQDFVHWAKMHGIAVGPGRGSAAGSVICYILNITGLDPFYFKLPFERFLNPSRPSAPDIDLDFADDKREDVVAYVTEKFGNDKVAQIITFGTMEAKGAIRDAGRALGMPYIKPDRISKMIPLGIQGNAMTLEKALVQSAELALAYQSEPETKRLIDVAKKLEGVARHASVHAAGVVISDQPLTDHTPLQKETRGEKIITQYDMYTVGENGVGLLKMDFLGLRNLTIVSQALAIIEKTRNKKIDLDHIPLDDKKTFQMLANAETTGIFQLESPGMRRYIKELAPTTIFDLMAMVALFRPGPMQVIPEFIKRKHDPSQIIYPDPRLKDVLKQSYGIIAYQDDVLLTAITLAGYSWGEADKLRKAVGKKIPTEMKKQREKFINGCVKNGLSQAKAEEIFNLIEPFAGYGFNKAHAACYAMIAYQTAYLKANYTVEHMTAVLTAESRANTGPTRNEKISNIIAECRRIGLTILTPDVNTSDIEFSVEQGNIRFGLSAIKNVGSAAIESILTSRTKKQPFRSFYDFLSRVVLSKVNKKTVESLIKAGAMDQFGKRAVLLLALPNMIDVLHKKKKDTDKGQSGLFDDMGETPSHEPVFPDVPELPGNELLTFEKELLGFYLTAHPLSSYEKQLANLNVKHIGDISDEDVGSRTRIAGIIVDIKKIFTKTGNNEMAFVKIEDLTGTIETVVFPKIFSQSSTLLVPDTVIELSGKIDQKDEKKTILVDTVKKIDFDR